LDRTRDEGDAVPSVTVQRENVTSDEAMEALRTELGDHYTLTKSGGSGDVFKVKTSTRAYATVHVHQEPGATKFRVSGGGIIIGRIINEFGIARRVVVAIKQSPGLAGDK
jgi:hypothetical protein